MAFLHSGQPVDVDNMLKPTLDGLIGVSYVDDALLEQVLWVRQDLQVGLRLNRLSAVLLGAVVAPVLQAQIATRDDGFFRGTWPPVA